MESDYYIHLHQILKLPLINPISEDVSLKYSYIFPIKEFGEIIKILLFSVSVCIDLVQLFNSQTIPILIYYINFIK